jgi:quinol monooxygenase YgiN
LSAWPRIARAEPGNLLWDVWRDQTQGERYVLDELYLDAATAEAHRKTPHYQDYSARSQNSPSERRWR